jgi:plasmid maintenance system antidote protein VapI
MKVVVAKLGWRETAELCGVSSNTLRRFVRGEEVSLGTMVRIGKEMP